MIRALLASSAAALAAMFICACDDSQAARHVSPGWERMQTQARGESFGESSVFADDRAMRTPPPGTLPTNALDVPDVPDVPDDATGGAREDAGTNGIPIAVDVQMINRGRESFEIYCATCHGMRGDSDSVVASKMQERRPPSLHDARIVQLSDDYLAGVVRHGYGFMPAFASQLDPRQRWEVVAYVRALQASQVQASTLSPDAQHALEEAR